jgi:hypothetical protein
VPDRVGRVGGFGYRDGKPRAPELADKTG